MARVSCAAATRSNPLIIYPGKRKTERIQGHDLDLARLLFIFLWAFSWEKNWVISASLLMHLPLLARLYYGFSRSLFVISGVYLLVTLSPSLYVFSSNVYCMREHVLLRYNLLQSTRSLF
jgi:hypothetical protein